MTDHEDLTMLDQRASTAAADLRTIASRRQRPATEDARALTLQPEDTSGGRRGLAVAAVLLAVVAAASIVWFSVQSGTDDQEPAEVNSTQPRAFGATTLPDGVVFSGAGQDDGPLALGRGTRPLGPARALIYGPAALDPQLGVVVLEPSALRQLDGTARAEIPAVTVDGVEALVYDDIGLATHFVVVPEGDRGLALVSPSLGTDELVAIAAQTTVDGDAVLVAEGALPNGWSQIAELDEGLVATSPIDLQAGPIRSTLYGEGDPDQQLLAQLAVSSSVGDALAVNLSALMAPRSERLVVRGHDAVLADSSGPDQLGTKVLSWIERPGELVAVTGIGLSTEELVAVAEGLEPMSEAEWDELRALPPGN